MAYTPIVPAHRKMIPNEIKVYVNSKNKKVHIYDDEFFQPQDRVDVLINDNKKEFLIVSGTKKNPAAGPRLTKTGSGVSFTSVPFMKNLNLVEESFKITGQKIKHDDRTAYQFEIPEEILKEIEERENNTSAQSDQTEQPQIL